jgi:hypothetical protein
VSGRTPRPQVEDNFRETPWVARGLIVGVCLVSEISQISCRFSGYPWHDRDLFFITRNRISETPLGLHPRHELSYGCDHELTNTTKADAPASAPTDRGLDLQLGSRKVIRTLNAGRWPVKRRVCAGVQA